MTRKNRQAFSLIEVLLAVGVVGFALLAIFALVGGSLNANSEAATQQEALGVSNALKNYLNEQVKKNGFSTVYGWIKGGSTPELYGYNVAEATGSQSAQGVIRNAVNDSGVIGTEKTKRTGRLFRIQLSLSPNMPIMTAAGTSPTYVSHPTAGDLPSNADNYLEAVLPIQVLMKSVPDVEVAPQPNSRAVLTYDFALPR
jgi:type II secretory pathway pseudopilin PulG